LTASVLLGPFADIVAGWQNSPAITGWSRNSLHHGDTHHSARQFYRIKTLHNLENLSMIALVLN